MVGLTATASFISYDLIWANKRFGLKSLRFISESCTLLRTDLTEEGAIVCPHDLLM